MELYISGAVSSVCYLAYTHYSYLQNRDSCHCHTISWPYLTLQGAGPLATCHLHNVHKLWSKKMPNAISFISSFVSVLYKTTILTNDVTVTYPAKTTLPTIHHKIKHNSYIHHIKFPFYLTSFWSINSFQFLFFFHAYSILNHIINNSKEPSLPTVRTIPTPNIQECDSQPAHK